MLEGHESRGRNVQERGRVEKFVHLRCHGLRSGTNHCPFPSVNLVQIRAKWGNLITDQTRKRCKLWKIWLASFEFIASSPRIRLALGKCMQIWNLGWLNKHCRLHFEQVFSPEFSLQTSNFMLLYRGNNVGSVFPHNALQRWVAMAFCNQLEISYICTAVLSLILC